ncbi:MAG: hypothetical protein J7L03_07100, partial [Caldisericaceae bacterium]|nr:hypothetical protein [Caldisericaceae bacterium]
MKKNIIVVLTVIIAIIRVGLYFWFNSPQYGLKITKFEIHNYYNDEEIYGVLTNRTSREFSHIVIEFAAYDKDNYQVGTFSTIIGNLQPHSKTRFHT